MLSAGNKIDFPFVFPTNSTASFLLTEEVPFNISGTEFAGIPFLL
jgi:hypothetical protein